ncbi:eukaryotic mitochondrial regulator protein-domain-containing protein [Xylariomycetidae sp. FL0641]|nr:eukaryotic mitochondrial regulator protein-domain-containing protein [Xylariomycetidae sp. FL0641]
MAPRIPSVAATASSVGRLAASSSSTTPKLLRPWGQTAAAFSTTPCQLRFTKARKLFRAWIATEGKEFKRHNMDRPKYVTFLLDRKDKETGELRPSLKVFKQNKTFTSKPVLDESSRELIWSRVMQNGESIKAVSAEFGVDIRRVAAVVRLKEVEKDWVAKGKKLARPYAKAVMNMLPRKKLSEERWRQPFEPINDLHVHPYTMQQIFWPTSESREFTREDAAKVFHKNLLSADKRVPLPELIQMEKDVRRGVPIYDAAERFKQAAMDSETRAAQKRANEAALQAKYTTRVPTARHEFRFKQYNSENVGPRGKARHAVGWRYGAPYYDRQKDHQIKIPTSVP